MNELNQVLLELPHSIPRRMRVVNGLVWLLIFALYASFFSLVYHNQQIKAMQVWQGVELQLKNHVEQLKQSVRRDASLLQHNESVLNQFLSVSMGEPSEGLGLPTTSNAWMQSSVFALYDIFGVYLGGAKQPLWRKLESVHDETAEGWYQKDGVYYRWVRQAVYYEQEHLGYLVLAQPLDVNLLKSWTPRQSVLEVREQPVEQPLQAHDIWISTLEQGSTQRVLLLKVRLHLGELERQQQWLEAGLGLALLLSLLWWMLVFRRYIGDAVKRLKHLQTRMSEVRLGEVVDGPEQLMDEVDLLHAAFAGLTVRLQQKRNLLEEKSQLLQTVLHAAPVAIWMLDEHGKVNFINRYFQRFLGVVHADEVYLPQELYDFSRQVLGGHQLYDARDISQVSVLQNEDKKYDFHVICSQLRDDKQQVSGVVGLALDMTAMRQAQAEKGEMEQQVKHVQRLEGLGVLASGIAHDFNNLLAIIMGHAELAQHNTDTLQEHLKKITEASASASELCQQMLAYAGEAQYDWQCVDISKEVADIASLLNVSHGKNVSLKMDLCDEPCVVKADVAQFHQVVMNLVINASESMEGKTGEVHVSTGQVYLEYDDLSHDLAAEEAKAGHYAFVRVKDEGCGMSQDTLAKMFDPFFTTKFTGRGLGMSAVLGIVRSHHGAMNIQTKVGVGTVMTVYFPLLEESIGVETSQNVVEASESLMESDAQDTLLIVDDEKEVRELLGMFAKVLGYEALEAESGEQALEMYRQYGSRIDAVVLDMTMPHMDGQACFDALCELDEQVTVVLSSGYDASDLMARFKHRKPDAFLQKPYRMDAFKSTVRAVLNERKLRSQVN